MSREVVISPVRALRWPLPVALAALACNGTAGMMAPAGSADGSTAEPPAPSAEGHWESLPSMPDPKRQYAGVAAVGKQLFVVGGFSTDVAAKTVTVYDAVTAYDTVAGSWRTVAPLPVRMPGPNVAGVGGKLYVLGGLDLHDAFSYDVVSDKWSALTPMPVERGHGMAAVGVWGTKILLAGGAITGQSANMLNTGVRQSACYSYDTATDTWEALPDLALARGYAMGAVVGNKFWVIGGSSTLARTSDVVALDLTTRTWSDGAPPPVSLSSAGSGVLGGRIYVVGGIATSSGAVGPETLVYDPPSSAWTPLAPMKTPRFAMGAAVVGGRIYVPGGIAMMGADTYAPVPVLEVFVP